ncbi:MAG: acyl-CoA dehydrogenase [Actinobacteria bacterium]|nr:MAG: acyl-CoA dehydrogenase [Actinomycetota bacterium]
MEFTVDATTQELMGKLNLFMDECIYPAEAELDAHAPGNFNRPPSMEALKAEARKRGLWNLFLPHDARGAGLTNVQYAQLAEITGRSPMLAPEALNCSAPDTGNMEVLAQFGNKEQQDRWLTPLLAGEIRSAFVMTEPDVASSDANNIEMTMKRDGDDYVINGRKWWSTGAMSPKCEILIVMGKTNLNGEKHKQQSMILVPMKTPGVKIERALTVYGYDDGAHGGHAEMSFTNVRVPVTNLISTEGSGFAIAQARLGPGRIHHCMRTIGMAERALELMCKRALTRTAFGKPLADQGVIQDWIGRSRVEIETVRLLTLKAAWLMDTVGNREAHTEIQAIKIAAPEMVLRVIDRAIQAHGGAGVSQVTPLAHLWASARTLRLADGPDEVHIASLARKEIRKYQ